MPAPHLLVPLLAVLFLLLPARPVQAGYLFAVSGNTGQVLQYDGTTGLPVGTGVFVGSGASYGLAFGPNGNLYVGNTTLGEILEFNGTTGAPVGTGVFVPPGSAGTPYGLTFGPNGNLFVSSRFTGPGHLGQVLEFNGTTGAPVGTGVFVQAGMLVFRTFWAWHSAPTATSLLATTSAARCWSSTARRGRRLAPVY